MDPTDKLTIDTPEQTPLEFTLAGIGSRFLALAMDMLIQLVAFLALFILLALLGEGLSTFWAGARPWMMALLVLAVFFLSQVYFAFFEAVWNGQTPGKRYTRLRVIKDSGNPLTPYEAIIRNLLRIVDWLPGIYAVGIVTMLLNRRNKRLGDYVAGTVVVHERPFEELQPVLSPRQRPASLGLNSAQLTSAEWQLVESFLSRRDYLTPELRDQMARTVVNRLRPKIGGSEEGSLGPEALLETLAQSRWKD